MGETRRSVSPSESPVLEKCFFLLKALLTSVTSTSGATKPPEDVEEEDDAGLGETIFFFMF